MESTRGHLRLFLSKIKNIIHQEITKFYIHYIRDFIANHKWAQANTVRIMETQNRIKCKIISNSKRILSTRNKTIAIYVRIDLIYARCMCIVYVSLLRCMCHIDVLRNYVTYAPFILFICVYVCI